MVNIYQKIGSHDKIYRREIKMEATRGQVWIAPFLVESRETLLAQPLHEVSSRRINE